MKEQQAQQQVFDFLKDTTGHSTLLVTPIEMIPFSNNSFSGARFLSQLLFWVGDRHEFVAIPFKEWKEVANLSRHSIETARHFFSNMGVLEHKVKKDSQGNPVCHYRLNFKALMSSLKEFFKDIVTARKVIFSGFADCLKAKGKQSQSEMSPVSKPPYKETLESKNIGQHTIQPSKQGKRDKYENFYL